MSKQPRALELADQLESDCLNTGISRREHLDYRIDVAALLRSQHELIGELCDALRKARETTYSDTLFAAWGALLFKAKEQQ